MAREVNQRPMWRQRKDGSWYKVQLPPIDLSVKKGEKRGGRSKALKNPVNHGN